MAIKIRELVQKKDAPVVSKPIETKTVTGKGYSGNNK